MCQPTRVPRSCRERDRDSLKSPMAPRGSSCPGLYRKASWEDLLPGVSLTAPLLVPTHQLHCQRAQESVSCVTRPRFICIPAGQTICHGSWWKLGEPALRGLEFPGVWGGRDRTTSDLQPRSSRDYGPFSKAYVCKQHLEEATAISSAYVKRPLHQGGEGALRQLWHHKTWLVSFRRRDLYFIC